jgi:anaerobic selenocysteine-containing dehydrogenase
VNVHTQSRTAGFKWLAEIVHKNHALVNADTAADLGIKTGDLIRVTTKVGYAVTKAQVTEGIHPRVVGVSNHCGHWAYGRLAQAKANGSKEGWSHGADDPDLKNVWWSDRGVHINSIIPVTTDPIGGGQAWYSVVAKLEKAKSGDKYGTVKADPAKHMEALKETERYAYNGDMNRKMHPELDIDWSKLPKPGLKTGH